MTKTILVSAIDDSDRLRPVDPDHAAWIAASIEAKGLLQPIIVRSADGGYKLTAGGHRLAAMKLLGWEKLTVGEHVLIREEVSDAAARIAEIDENLARRDLNKLDRIIFIAERKALYEQEHPETKHGGDRKAQKFKEKIKSQTLRLDPSPRFTKEVAARVGLSERTIQLAWDLAQKLDREALASLRGTSLEDNQNELIQLSEISPQEQRKVAAFVRSGEARTVVQAKVAAGLAQPQTVDPQKRIYAALIDNWGKASRQTRAQFLADIGAELVKRGAQS